jgi:hypothetical protein
MKRSFAPLLAIASGPDRARPGDLAKAIAGTGLPVTV